MRADMNAEGVITLRAENSLERFALRQWIGQAEQTTYVDDFGSPTRRAVRAWSQSSLVVETDVIDGGAA